MIRMWMVQDHSDHSASKEPVGSFHYAKKIWKFQYLEVKWKGSFWFGLTGIAGTTSGGESLWMVGPIQLKFVIPYWQTSLLPYNVLSSSADFIFVEAWGMEKKMIRAIPCGWQGLTGNIVSFSLIWLLLHVHCNICRLGWRNRKHQVNPCPESGCIHSFDARWSNIDLDQCSWNAPLVIIVQDELFLVYSRMKGNSQSFQALNAFLQSTHV